MKQEYWTTTDTHFNHENLIELTGRKKGYELSIITNHAQMVKENDILIHLGDVCIGRDEYWNNAFTGSIKCKRKILVLGNHDKKSVNWYLNHGWDFVCKTFELNMYGKRILFSHIPQPESRYDLNIHGHFHNSDHRRHESELVKIKNEKQLLIMLEHGYKPFKLRTLCNQ